MEAQTCGGEGVCSAPAIGGGVECSAITCGGEGVCSAIEKSNQECGQEKNECENEDAKKTTFYSSVPDLGLIKSTKYAGSKKKRKDKKPSLKSLEKTENLEINKKLENKTNTNVEKSKKAKYGNKFRKGQKFGNNQKVGK